MHTPLLSFLASRQGIRRLLGTTAGLALLLGAADAQAQSVVYGLGTLTADFGGLSSGQQGLANINPTTGAAPLISTAITGVTLGQTLVGIDSRPNTGQLFALGYNASLASPTANTQLYVLDPATSIATAVGNAFRLELGGATDRIGFDFNPTVDRIRVVSTNDANYRINPTPNPSTGAIAVTIDGTLTYAVGSLNPGIGSVAYTNSYFGSSNTTLYDFDELNTTAPNNPANTALLSIQNPPNVGTLVTPVNVMFGPAVTGSPQAADIDIYFDPATKVNQGYLVEVTASGSTNFYTLDLGTGMATLRANTVPAVFPFVIRDIAAAIAPQAALTAVTGQLLYGVTASNNLITFDSNNPGVVRSLVAISGLPATQTLVGTDFRPNTGQLFGLGYDATPSVAPTVNSQLYTINLTSGVATAVGSAIRLELGGATEHIAFDFNPTVDRIRVEGTSDANYRLNPNTGGIASSDLTLNYAAGVAAGQNPSVGTAAYVNSYVGATATGLYTIDHALGLVSFQNPPNDGILTNQRALTGVNGVGTGGAIGPINDLDIYYNGTTNVPYLVAAASATPNNSRLYTLNALSATDNSAQVATDGGAIGLGISVRDISVPLSAASLVAGAPGAVTGQLLYAIAGGNLISFDSNAPSVIRSAVNFGGGITAGQTVVGTDFRPADGQLYALGYDPSIATPANNSQLYTVNLTTGGLTAVGTAQRLDLGAGTTQVGFDFNPTVDRIRVVSTNNANYRLNPTNGAIASIDTNLNGTTGTYSATAYTNNQSSANTTTQYVFDATDGSFRPVSNPNGGVVASVPQYFVTGVSTTTGADFDIYNTPGTTTNQGFIATAASTASANDNLYVVGDFGSPFNFTVTNAGLIGQGSNVTGLAAFIQAGTLLTWNGSVSTDWGTAANWTPAQVPAANNDVTIPSGTPNQPTVSNAQQARLVTLTTGAVLTLANGGTLTTGGSFTNNGGSVAGTGTGTLVLGGTASVIGGTSLSAFPNLTVTNAASTAAPVSIQRALTLNGTLTVGAGQAFTLLSNAAGTAYAVNNGAAVLTGTATVQRYITPNLNAGPGYRHYSAPVANSTVNDLATAGFTPTVNGAYNGSATPGSVTPFPTVYSYDQTRTALSNPMPEFDRGFQSPAALTDALEVGRGYTVNIGGSQLVDFVGTLNNGSVSRAGLGRGTQATAGYHLLGNPYPGAIDYTTVQAASTGMEPALYVFKSSGQYTGSYASYNNGATVNGGTNIVPVAQGFFLRTAAGQTGAVNFTNAARTNTPDNTPFQRTTDVRPRLTLALRNATLANQTAVYFEQGATSSFDSGFDAHYLPATNGLTLATEATAEALSINGLPVMTGTDVVVPLQVAAATAGTYTLQVDELGNLPAGYFAYLRDGLTGTYTNLTPTTSIPLTLTANGAAGGRYAVVFSTQNRVLATAPAALAQLVSVYPNPARGSATLLLPVALRGQQATTVTVVDNVGRAVLTRTLAAGAVETLELPLTGLAPGVYSVLARTASGLVAKRLVVQ